MYSNNILNFQESMTILNVCTKKSGNLLNAPCIYIYIRGAFNKFPDFFVQAFKIVIYIYIYIYLMEIVLRLLYLRDY